ncbi:hypothetical protein [Mesorhizobium sp. M0239]|uniref:hypothetical protein n=1 Tax=Mesorhizobium sp. M0239 TaxID=2956924 RepID=UPI00333B17AF
MTSETTGSAFERSEPAVEREAYPVCIAGKRKLSAGRLRRHLGLLGIASHPGDPSHPQRAEEFGDEFDPDEFVLDVTNAALAFGSG